jgi:hypothetical protein
LILPFVGGANTLVSINNRRMVVGSSRGVDEDWEGTRVGFALLERFLDPIDFVENARNALVTGQNDRGEIVGLLNLGDGSEIGVRHSLGKLEFINVPDASLPPNAYGHQQ